MKTSIALSVASMFLIVSLGGCETAQEPYSLTGDEGSAMATMSYPYDPSSLSDERVDEGY